eukprot:2978_1
MASSAKFVKVLAGLSELQLHLYKSIITRDLEIINNETTVNNATLIGTVMQLKQCCCHPYLLEGLENEQTKKHRSESLDPEHPTTHHLIQNCGKLFVMDRLITKIRDEANTILLCTSIKEMFEYFEAYCNHRGLSHYCIHNNTPTLTESASNASILIHLTSNHDVFPQVIESFPSIDTVIFYDTDWSVKHKQDDIIRNLEEKCEDIEGLTVYIITTKDTVEEPLYLMPQKQKSELTAKELNGLIRYKATKILNTNSAATLDREQDIEDMLSAILDDDLDSSSEEEEVELANTYTMKDVVNHPDNQGVLRLFVSVFMAMIIVPVFVVIGLNKYVMKHILLEWSDQAKQNITIVVGVAVAHLIALIYMSYAYSIDDDDEDEDEEKTDALPHTNDIINAQVQEDKMDKNGQNGLRKRR